MLLLQRLCLLIFVDWTHYIINYVLDCLLLDNLGWQAHQDKACLKMFFEVEQFFEGLEEKYQVLRGLMAESLADDPKVLGVFKYTLEENLYIFDTPDLPSFVLSLIVDRIPYELWS